MPATSARSAQPARPGRGPHGGLRRDLAVGALLLCATLIAIAAGGAFKAAPAGATADGPPALVLQCPLGVHRVALPRGSAGQS